MKYPLISALMLLTFFASGQSFHFASYFSVEQLGDLNTNVPNRLNTDDLMYDVDQYVRIEMDATFLTKHYVRTWVELDIGLEPVNVEVAYGRKFGHFRPEVFYRRNLFYLNTNGSYPDSNFENLFLNQIGIGLGYDYDWRRISFSLLPQYIRGFKTNEIKLREMEYGEGNFRAENREYFHFADYQSAGGQIGVDFKLLQRKIWWLSLHYEFYWRREWYEFSNQSERSEWTTDGLVWSEDNSHREKFDRTQHRMGFRFGLF